MFRKTFRWAAALMASLVLVSAAASTALAQSRDNQSSRTPATARDVLLLITEQVALERDERPTVRYWWVNPTSPEWTESDELLRQQLTDRGVDLVSLGGGARISRIYRMPSLSLSNAATLGSLLGARRVVVGTITYERQPGIGALGLERISASADVSLVSAESGESTPLHRFTVERAAFDPQVDRALERARQETTDALSSLIANTLMRGPGPVGVQTDEKLIGLRNAESAAVLESVTAFLEQLEQVERVAVRWAAEGLIALEVNPGRDDAEDTIDYVGRALANQSFEGFSVASRRSATAGSLEEFEVVQGDSERF